MDHAHPGNRTPVSTMGGYYDTTTLDALPYKNLNPCNKAFVTKGLGAF